MTIIKKKKTISNMIVEINNVRIFKYCMHIHVFEKSIG